MSHRAVEHAFAIHGNVEATLHALDGHHSQTHGNKVEQGCGGTDRYKAKKTSEMKEGNRTIEVELNTAHNRRITVLSLLKREVQ